ncbi:MAG: SIR2 family protein, partial [Mobilitalea sp.]
MLIKDFIDLINHGEAIAIIGSGVSTDAGLPSWWNLFDIIADQIDSSRLSIKSAIDLKNKNKLPEAFQSLANITTREDIHRKVIDVIKKIQKPGYYHTQMADWPFKFYITTNYDHLLEKACGSSLLPVGNRGDEIRKLSAG